MTITTLLIIGSIWLLTCILMIGFFLVTPAD
jgi:hypothetical protein